MLQFENRIVDQRIDLEVIEDLEKPHAADALAEKSAQHRILRPDVTVFGRNMLHDVVGGRAQNVFCGVGLMLGDSRRSDVALEKLYRVGDLLHQACKRRAHQRHAQAPEQLQQRPGRAHDRIGVGRHQFVDAQHRSRRLGQRLRQRRRRRRISSLPAQGSRARTHSRPAVTARRDLPMQASANTARAGGIDRIEPEAAGACGSLPPGLGRMIVRSTRPNGFAGLSLSFMAGLPESPTDAVRVPASRPRNASRSMPHC